ncbi:BTAD domain-containing putative transcriptional regulator [Mesorhizobium sp. M0626]|uniref:BTAD domain-containing putative transcriptional regulator n=1 Tax=Mesorhizobium sp. M0626 TaxID=2956976 RepID=UPI003339D3F7
MDGNIRLTIFGKAALAYEGREVPIVNRKSIALLAYLANTLHGSESRERLAGLLWSESSEERARASLRQTVGDLKDCLAVCETMPFTADRLNVYFRLPLVRVDLHEMRESLARGTIDPVLLERKRLCDSLLSGFEDLDPGFRTWLMVQRQCLHDEFVRYLEDIVAAPPDIAMLKRAGLALLNLDPTHELGCRAAMEASARLGDLAGSLRLYKSLWDVLGEDFDSEPSEKTQDLVLDIKMGRVEPPRGAEPVGSSGGEPTARNAVTFFGSQSPQPQINQSLFLFVGPFEASEIATIATASIRIFRHELVASLVRFRDWGVLDLEGRSPVDVGRPAFLIEATAFDGNGSLRVVLTLKEIATGRFIWSEQFSIEATDWYQTQQRMIRRIAVALDVSMSSERLTQVSSIPDLSLDQFDKWLRAQELIFRWRPQDEAKAEALFRSIISEAPRFAPAYSGIAGILNSRHLMFPGILRAKDQHAEALSLAKTAVQIDPIDSRTQLHLAWSYAMNGMPDRAGLNFLLACELNSNDPWTLVSASLGLAYCDDLDNAERLSKLALDIGLGLSKLHWSYQASIRFILEDFAGCINAANQAEDIVFYIGAWKAAACAIVGDLDAAHLEFQKFVSLIRANWFSAQPPSNEEVVRWLLQCFPIASPKVLANLERGLELAGLAAPRQDHTLLPAGLLAAAPDRVVGDA